MSQPKPDFALPSRLTDRSCCEVSAPKPGSVLAGITTSRTACEPPGSDGKARLDRRELLQTDLAVLPSCPYKHRAAVTGLNAYQHRKSICCTSLGAPHHR